MAKKWGISLGLDAFLPNEVEYTASKAWRGALPPGGGGKEIKKWLENGKIGERGVGAALDREDRLVLFTDTDEKGLSEEEAKYWSVFDYTVLPRIDNRKHNIPVMRNYHLAIRLNPIVATAHSSTSTAVPRSSIPPPLRSHPSLRSHTPLRSQPTGESKRSQRVEEGKASRVVTRMHREAREVHDARNARVVIRSTPSQSRVSVERSTRRRRTRCI